MIQNPERGVRLGLYPGEKGPTRKGALGGAEVLGGYDLLVLEKMVETEREGASFLPISSSQNCGGPLEVQSGQIEARFSMDPSASF